jgi:hypothetical protein
VRLCRKVLAIVAVKRDVAPRSRRCSSSRQRDLTFQALNDEPFVMSAVALVYWSNAVLCKLVASVPQLISKSGVAAVKTRAAINAALTFYFVKHC